MEKIIRERSDDFVDLKVVIPDCLVDLKYFGNDNFVGERIEGYEADIAYATKRTALALKKVQDKLVKSGYGLKIFDAYRPVRAVKAFFEWGQEHENGLTKADYYPDFTRNEIFEKGFIASPSAHSRGSTVDLTLINLKSHQDIDMGGSFDFFSEVSYFDYKNLSEIQKKNRCWLRDIMMQEGFVPFEYEWWHFTLKDEPYKKICFDFIIR
ncbi:M15 family metallopeptidase [Eubacteriaceae bacterium ES3]|nr:M15 family metallopeptidase [Eubacteriaceae bacterium ES3]